jgi:CheY-like chemotaxis protein
MYADPSSACPRVLIIDDNRDGADSLRMVLDLHGYEARTAYTGPEGVRAALEFAPDFVVCDIGLPGLDGYEVAGALRQQPVTAKAHLIALTTYHSDEARMRCREAGFERHLVKPADVDALLDLLAGGR